MKTTTFLSLLLAALAALIAATAARAETPAKIAPFRFAVITDTHITPDPAAETNKNLTAVAQKLSTLQNTLDFVMNTGDLVDHLALPWEAQPEKYTGKNARPIPAMEEYKRIMRENFRIPWHTTIGNHDFYWNVAWNPSLKRQRLEKMLLSALADTNSFPSLYYSFDHKGFNMISLDSVSLATNHTETWIPGFDEKQLDWLEAQLATGKPAVIFMHHYPAAPINRWQKSEGKYALPESARINKIIKAHAASIKMVFVGHGEIFVKDKYYGVPAFMTGNPGVPPGYHIVECAPAALSCRIVNESEIKYTTYKTEE